MDGRVKLAQAMIKAKNYGPATNVLAQYLHTRPQDLEALFLYGTALYRSNNDKGAEAAFRRILLASPKSAKAHYSLGITLIRQGRIDEAKASLLRSLQINPNFTQAHARLAELGASGTPTPTPKPGPPADDIRLSEGELIHRGHRRLSSFAGRFVLAVVSAFVGYWLMQTARPGRLIFLAQNPPLQFPSIDFLRGQYETTGQEIHRVALEEALARVAERSAVLDQLLDWFALGLIVLAALMAFHALLASRTTVYEVYERRIDVRKGVLNRRRFDAWLFEITDVELRQSPMLTLTRNAEVTIHLEQTSVDKPSRFKLRIIGFGSLRKQEKFYAELRNAALRERRALKNWFV